MIKILKNSKAAAAPIKVTCEHCGSELEVEEEDLHEGYMGAKYFVCPVCMEHAYVDDEYEADITVDTLKFPDHFFYFGGKDAVEISDEDILKWIKNGVKYFRENPDSFSYSIGSGDAMVHIENFSGDKEYHVTVAQGYYDTEIPYEKEDYLAQARINWGWENKGVKIMLGEDTK